MSNVEHKGITECLRLQRMRRSRVRLHRLIRKVEEINMKLYLENKGIMEANNQLRKRALLLRQENLVLLLQFQKKVSHEHVF